MRTILKIEKDEEKGLLVEIRTDKQELTRIMTQVLLMTDPQVLPSIAAAVQAAAEILSAGSGEDDEEDDE